MNKAQKIIISVGLMIMGLWVLLCSYYLMTEGYSEDVLSVSMSLLGLAFIVAALVILFSLKIRK